MRSFVGFGLSIALGIGLSTAVFTVASNYVSLANQAAIHSPLVSATAIDATEFPDLVRRYHVNGVPKIVINDTMEVMGAAPEEHFISAIAGAAIED